MPGMNRRSFEGGWEGKAQFDKQEQICYSLEDMFQVQRKERLQVGKKSQTPTFLLELPLVIDEGQAKRIRAHLEAGRAFYNAVLSEGQRRLRQMRADAAWQGARA